MFRPTAMSAIASFTKLPQSALTGLRSAAASGADDAYLSANRSEVAEYRWSGYVLATLLPYLEEKQRIDLMKSEYDELAAFPTDSTGATHFIFTPNHRTTFGNRLEPTSFSEDEMRQYFNEFNATNEKEIGRAIWTALVLLESVSIKSTTILLLSSQLARVATLPARGTLSPCGASPADSRGERSPHLSFLDLIPSTLFGLPP